MNTHMADGEPRLSRRGQVTLFFAIGIVLLIVVLLIVYIVNVAKDRPEANTAGMTAAAKYLGTCVDSAFEDSMVALQQNGGAFLDPALDGKSYETVSLTTKVPPLKAVAITADRSVTVPGDRDPGVAPVLDPQDDLDDAASHLYLSDMFGTITIPHLCSRTGPNANVFGNINCLGYVYNPISEPGASIQDAITRRIQQGVISCMSSPGVDDKIGLKVSELGNPDVHVIYSTNTVSVEVTFPDAPHRDSLHTVKVLKTYKARLYMFYHYIFEQLMKNTKDPRDPVASDTSSSYYLPGFFLGMPEELVVSGTTYHLWQATDTNFFGQGDSFTWQLVVEDRPTYQHTEHCVDPDDQTGTGVWCCGLCP